MPYNDRMCVCMCVCLSLRLHVCESSISFTIVAQYNLCAQSAYSSYCGRKRKRGTHTYTKRREMHCYVQLFWWQCNYCIRDCVCVGVLSHKFILISLSLSDRLDRCIRNFENFLCRPLFVVPQHIEVHQINAFNSHTNTHTHHTHILICARLRSQLCPT